MSIEQGPSFVFNEAVPAFRVVSLNASSSAANIRVELADTSASMPIGIVQDSVTSGASGDVRTLGVARAQCGASVSAGAILTWQADTGKVIEAAASTATITTRCIGVALYPGSTDSVILVSVNPQLIANI